MTSAATPPTPSDRFDGGRLVFLDALRGIAALAVAWFHFYRLTPLYHTLDPVMPAPLEAALKHGFVGVDIFFVLSGFVIANAYCERVSSGETAVSRFMALRMGRIFPLHVAVLAAFVLIELAKLITGLGDGRAPFSGSYSLSGLISSLLLVHCFGLQPALTWNMPSWSIAAEMWTYLLFALVYATFSKRGWLVFSALGILALATMLMFAPHGLDSTYDFGFVRCVFSFALGICVHRLYARGVRIGGDLAEWTVLFLVVAFVSFLPGGIGNFAGPFLFAVTVLVFATGGGSASRLLTTRPLVLLGTISYSIYMVHMFVQQRMGSVLKRIGSDLGIALPDAGAGTTTGATNISAPPLVGDLLMLIMIVAVLIAATLTYNLIERPGREWARARFANRKS